MNVKVKIKVPKELYESIRLGTEKAAERVLADVRNELAKYTPEVYQDYGAELSNMLKSAGIEPVAGAMLTAWGQTIDDIDLDRRFKDCTLKLFDARHLQRGTAWVGTTKKPFTFKTSNKPRLDSGYGKRQQLKIGNLGAAVQDDNAYRPLPAANKVSVGKKVSSFVWAPNPYQGYGYWLLYEQGYHSGGIAYEGRFFIRDAYSSILGINANRMFTGTDTTLTLNQRMVTKLKTYMANEITKAAK